MAISILPHRALCVVSQKPFTFVLTEQMEGVKRYYRVAKRKRSKYDQGKPAKRTRVEELGRITGKVSPASTTLAKAPGPFHGLKHVTFVYENELTYGGAPSAFQSFIVASNDMYDFDKTTSVFGNKQPLYFDQLLTTAGPYRQFKVISWKTTFTIVNTSDLPITVFGLPPHSDPSDLNSATECDNWPGVKRLFLSAKGGKDTGTLTMTGHINDVYQDISQNGLVGTYTASPGVLIYGGLGISCPTGGSPPVYLAVKHEAFTELNNVDAVVS